MQSVSKMESMVGLDFKRIDFIVEENRAVFTQKSYENLFQLTVWVALKKAVMDTGVYEEMIYFLAAAGFLAAGFLAAFSVLGFLGAFGLAALGALVAFSTLGLTVFGLATFLGDFLAAAGAAAAPSALGALGLTTFFGLAAATLGDFGALAALGAFGDLATFGALAFFSPAALGALGFLGLATFFTAGFLISLDSLKEPAAPLPLV